MFLTINAGSSSLRLALFRRRGGELERVGFRHTGATAEAALVLDAFLDDVGVEPSAIEAVAHRVVHGGTWLRAPVLVSGEVERAIEAAAALAPLHNPRALAWIRAARRALPPSARHVAVFDTGFFADLPAVAASYALPDELVERHGLRRFGFHGLAHRWMSTFCRRVAPRARRVITLQLGSGCSATAVLDGRAVDTSMGFSPAEGLVMATRVGDIDPGLLIYLLRHGGMSAAELEETLTRRSGLLGVSGRSGDMREVLACAAAGDERCEHALALYCYRVRKYIGAYVAVLGGVDALLFGGGVGARSAEVRRGVLEGMRWCGLELDPQRNERAEGNASIGAEGARAAVWTVSVDEEQVLAHEAAALLGGEAS